MRQLFLLLILLFAASAPALLVLKPSSATIRDIGTYNCHLRSWRMYSLAGGSIGLRTGERANANIERLIRLKSSIISPINRRRLESSSRDKLPDSQSNEEAIASIMRLSSRLIAEIQSGELLQSLKRSLALTASSLYRNLRRTRWGEERELWTLAALSLCALIYAGRLPIALAFLVRSLGNVLMATGAFLTLFSALALGEAVYPFPHPVVNRQVPESFSSSSGTAVVSEGPYSAVRHPMYGGILLFFGGLTIASNSLPRAIMTFLLGILLNKISSIEETLLIQTYHQEYELYREGKYKFLPFLF